MLEAVGIASKNFFLSLCNGDLHTDTEHFECTFLEEFMKSQGLTKKKGAHCKRLAKRNSSLSVYFL